MVDLTAGYGVDTYFLSENFQSADYVEPNEELCRIAAHNFANKYISIHNTRAEEFLSAAGLYDLIYLDPARRDSHGSKVFRIQDCTPNVAELLPALLQHLSSNGRVLIKLSPMLDITQAIAALSTVCWDVHVVAIKNEVKEVLFLSGGTNTITAIDLAEPIKTFSFTRDEEREAECQMVNGKCENGLWLYEPDAAILKAGAYKLVTARFGLQKLDVNTHLYTSDKLVTEFPGRIWRIDEIHAPRTKSQANVITRNYPLTPEQLKKKLHLRDGGTDYIIGCRVAGKLTLFLAQRIEDIHSKG